MKLRVVFDKYTFESECISLGCNRPFYSLWHVTRPLYESDVWGNLAGHDRDQKLVSIRTKGFSYQKQKQGHVEPHFHSKAWYLSTQL